MSKQFAPSEAVSFKNDADFLRWVATYYGSDVSRACKARLDVLLSRGEQPNRNDVLEELLTPDLTFKQDSEQFSARFVW